VAQLSPNYPDGRSCINPVAFSHLPFNRTPTRLGHGLRIRRSGQNAAATVFNQALATQVRWHGKVGRHVGFAILGES
jgi:hypothetical protein